MYRDFGLPDRWRAVASALTPFGESTIALTPAPIHDRLERAFTTIDARSRYVLGLRAVGETLDEIGASLDVTRERVRQIEKRATKQLLCAGNALLKDLADWLDDAGFGGHAIVRFTAREISYGSLGNIPEVDAWRILCHVVRQSHRSMQLHQLDGERYVVLGPGRKQFGRADAMVRESWMFVAPDSLESATGVPECLLLHATEAISGLRRTTSGLLFSEHWTKLQTAHAVALELVAMGFTSWHFSELGALLVTVHPDRFANPKARDFAALLARPDSRFAPAHGAGHWTLEPNDEELSRLTAPSRDPRTWCQRYSQRLDSNASQQPPLATEPCGSDAHHRTAVGTPDSSTLAANGESVDPTGGHEVAKSILEVLGDSDAPMTTIELAARLGVHRRIVHRALFDHLVPSGAVITDDGRRWRTAHGDGRDD